MPRLVLQFEGRTLQEHGVGSAVTIGRLPDNGLVIENPAVSGRHARVFREGDAFVVEDLQSTNGTFVNGTRITRQPLQDGDVLLVGKHKLVFELAGGDDLEPAEDGPSLPDLGGTMYLDTKQHREMIASLAAKKTETPAAGAAQAGGQATVKVVTPKKVATLRVMSGRADQTEYRLPAHTSLIGKSDTAVVRLKGWFKPKVAVAIARSGDRYTATQLGGKTLVNDEPLKGRRELKDGDVLQISGLVLEFTLKE